MMTAILEVIALREERDDLKGEVVRLRAALQTIAIDRDPLLNARATAREALRLPVEIKAPRPV